MDIALIILQLGPVFLLSFFLVVKDSAISPLTSLRQRYEETQAMYEEEKRRCKIALDILTLMAAHKGEDGGEEDGGGEGESIADIIPLPSPHTDDADNSAYLPRRSFVIPRARSRTPGTSAGSGFGDEAEDGVGDSAERLVHGDHQLGPLSTSQHGRLLHLPTSF